MTHSHSYGEKRLHKPFVTFKSCKNLVSAHFSRNRYLSSKSKRKISGYKLRDTDSDKVSSVAYSLCSVISSFLILIITTFSEQLCSIVVSLCIRVYNIKIADDISNCHITCVWVDDLLFIQVIFSERRHQRL